MSKIILVLFIFSMQSAYANTNEVISKALSKIYSPLKEVNDISFEIHSNEIKNLVESKVLINQIETLYMKSFWYKGTEDFQLVGAKKLEKIAQNEIIEVLKEKAAIVWGHDFNTWLEGYEFQKANGTWFIYKDMTGLKDDSELWIKAKGKVVKVIEKKATGSSRTTFTYVVKPWSEKKNVLVKIMRVVYEGIQNQKIESEIKYKANDGIYWLPSEINVKTTQGLAFEDRNKVKREITEHYVFKNYKINQESAVKWFSKKSE